MWPPAPFLELLVLTGCCAYISDNPKDFMIDQLSQLKNAKTTKKDYPCLFDSGNIEAMYRLMDPEGRGFITSAQFAEGNSSILNYHK